MKITGNTIIIGTIILLAALIRLIGFDQYPAGLNADEAAIGYNAYSLLQTGRDEHNASWPLVFRSFDDYKPPLYFYLVLPFVAALGLNVWAVRLPSALLGILSVWLIYRLANLLFPDKKIKLGRFKLDVGTLAAIILATSPWHIHFSRGGWEVNAATTFILLGFVFLYQAPRKYLAATLAFVGALYTYHSARLVLPLLMLGFLLLERKELFRLEELKKYGKGLALGTLLLIPLLFQLLAPSGQARFSGVSVFADEGPLWEALALRLEHGDSSLPVRVLHNKYVSYSLRLAKNYLSHFSPRFLYISGDEIERSRIPGMGQALLLWLPFSLVGALWLANQKGPRAKIILVWLVLAPIAAAITFQAPHALRAQNMVVPLTLVSAVGLWQALELVKHTAFRNTLVCLLLLLLGYEFGRFQHAYFLHYPAELPKAWEYGFEQLGSYLVQNQDKYDRIIISDRYDQPYILTAFFIKYPPKDFQNEIVLEARDKFGFSTVRRFGKYEFRPVSVDKDIEGNTLVVATEESGVGEPIHTVYFPSGEPAFRLYSKGVRQ